MTARNINCSTKCPLDGMRGANLKVLLEDCRTSKDSSVMGQYCTDKDQYRTSTRQSKE
jgi:hypothetical protein